MTTPAASPAGVGRPGPRRRPGEGGPSAGGGRKFTPRRKVCQFCADKIKVVDYKDLGRLRRFLSERGKIEPRRKTGTCAAHQRSLNVALKRARQLAMLPFTAEHIRITGVVVREPGAPPFRGARGPRPVEQEGVEAEAAVEPAAPAADGQAAAATPPEPPAPATTEPPAPATTESPAPATTESPAPASAESLAAPEAPVSDEADAPVGSGATTAR